MTKISEASEQITAVEYLKLPYTRKIIPEEDGTFRAEISEFPGCMATGETEVEALSSLGDIALSWISAAIDSNLSIPAPLEEPSYSGRFLVRLPKSLHKKAAEAAIRDGVSLNQFVVSSLAECVGIKSASNVHYTGPEVIIVTGPSRYMNYPGDQSNFLVPSGSQQFSEDGWSSPPVHLFARPQVTRGQ